jgi:hypothetical protein
VPAFSTDATTTHPHDFALARGGGVVAYLRDEVLADFERELDELGYARVRLNARAWAQERRLHEDFAATLNFPDYYGNNLNALADCLQDVACGDYGWDTARMGLAVTVGGFGHFAREDAALAHAVADLLTRTSSEAMAFGHRLLWLLHVDDPDFRMEPVGAVTVSWNGREWLDSHRR